VVLEEWIARQDEEWPEWLAGYLENTGIEQADEDAKTPQPGLSLWVRGVAKTADLSPPATGGDW
jgi:hypothetical protein